MSAVDFRVGIPLVEAGRALLFGLGEVSVDDGRS